MEIIMSTGARCFPRCGSFTVPGLVWSEPVGTKVATPAAGGNFRGAAVLGERPMYRTRFHALINPIGIDLPVTHRMRVSASEP
ncbi:MAG: hypothetical protein ACRDSL_19180 [Pseudonocardiaceae bacterium]